MDYLDYYEVYDDVTNKTLLIRAFNDEQAIGISETIDFNDYENGGKVDVLDEEPSFMCNSCHEHFPREEMDFDVDDDQDLCKNCNYQSYNDAPYGED
jgi:hypothetical protein